MESLDAALERARHVYADEREMIRPGANGKMIGVRTGASGKRDRLRKVSLARMLHDFMRELQDILERWVDAAAACRDWQLEERDPYGGE